MSSGDLVPLSYATVGPAEPGEVGDDLLSRRDYCICDRAVSILSHILDVFTLSSSVSGDRSRDLPGDRVAWAKLRPRSLLRVIDVFEDSEMTRPVLCIAQHNMLKLGPSYVVTDARRNEPVGALSLNALRLRQVWTIADPAGAALGHVTEPWPSALAWRFGHLFGSMAAPVRYRIDLSGQPAGEVRTFYSMIRRRVCVDATAGGYATLDGRLALAIGLVLCVHRWG